MAIIKNSVIGDITGRLDNIVFRKVNGKRVAYARPRKYKASQSRLAKTGRNNFAMSVKFARTIISVPALKEIWTLAKIEGSNSFQRIMKHNLILVKDGSLTTSNLITPPGLSLKITSASIQDKILHLSFLCPGSPDLKFPAVLYFYMYFNLKNKPVVYNSVTVEESPGGNYILDVVLNNQWKKIFVQDPNPILFLALAGGTVYRKKIYWTCTATKRLNS